MSVFRLARRGAVGVDDPIATALHAGQLAALFRQMPIALAVNLVNAAVVALTLATLIARPAPALWFGGVAAVTAARALLWWRYRRFGAVSSRRWSIAATAGAGLAGLAWGLGGALMLALVPPLAQLFLIIVIGGMCVGAVILSASHLPSLLAFLIAACVPMAVRFLTAGTATDTALGAMVVVFAVAMALAGGGLHQILSGSLRLRLELDEANRRLRAEMAQHRATEAALRQAQRLEAIGQVAGGIAHDFGNLLSVVIGNLTLARERLADASPAAPLIEAAVQAAERGIGLIQHLLGFARQRRLDPRPVDLGPILSGMSELLSRTLGPQIRLVLDIPDGEVVAEIDPSELELAVLNLAINARDAMPAGGTLRLAVAERARDAAAPGELVEGDYVVVTIADSGAGMDEATLAQAFDLFFTTKEPGLGTGLGLPTVQAFAVRSRGAVRLTSTPGAGTTAELWLPRPARSLPAAPNRAAAPPG